MLLVYAALKESYKCGEVYAAEHLLIDKQICTAWRYIEVFCCHFPFTHTHTHTHTHEHAHTHTHNRYMYYINAASPAITISSITPRSSLKGMPGICLEKKLGSILRSLRMHFCTPVSPIDILRSLFALKSNSICVCVCGFVCGAYLHVCVM